MFLDVLFIGHQICFKNEGSMKREVERERGWRFSSNFNGRRELDRGLYEGEYIKDTTIKRRKFEMLN